MKKVLQTCMAIALVIVMLVALPTNVSAADAASQDGIEFSITTDKDEYSKDDTIEIILVVKNTNFYKVEKDLKLQLEC